MKRRGAMALSLATGLALVAMAATSAAADDFGARAEDDAIRLSAFKGEQLARAHRANAGTPEAQLREYERASMCNTSTGTLTTPLNGPCPVAEGEAALNDCDDDVPVLPLWTRSRATPTSEWTAWALVADGGCPGDLLPTLTATDFQQLPIAPQTITIQPDRGWVLVNKETIVLTDPVEQTFRTDLFGYGVDVIATPTRYTWDFNDGSRPLSTDSPGKPYPAFDVFHVFTDTGTTTIALTTTWSGRYRIDGDDTWRDVVGTAQTTSTSAELEIVEHRSRLVARDCIEDPDQPDCL
jgi:hypothetical protein